MDRFLRTVFIFLVGLSMLESSYSMVAQREWWETALVYQIWPRGFQDSNGDGEGDLKGIISRLDYLQKLEVDAIWLSPIYRSPLIDSGYDISDYIDINPLFGNLEDFDELVHEAHRRDLKVILDIVPNHSSDQHVWFQLSAKRIEPFHNYYIWANGSISINGTRLPPNNWMSPYSEESGSAWTWNERRGQWYYHKFHKSQPDLNLRDGNVLNHLLEVFNFWLKRGVDGFRINAVSYLYEDKELRNEHVNGIYTSGQPENTILVYRFRSYIDNWVAKHNSTSKLLIAESYDSDDVLISLYGNNTQNGIPPFNFRFITSIKNTSTAEHIENVLQNWIKKLPNNASTNWVLSNHDNSRATSRIGLNRVDGLHMLSLLLPGQAYTYYGEEIAMLDRRISWEETIDPMGRSRTKETYEDYSRDPARTPMQWNSEISAGFSINPNTYLPVHQDYVERNVEAQMNNNRSNLNTYRLLSALRKEQVFVMGDYEFANLNDERVLVLKRFLENNPIYITVVNLGLGQEIVNLTSLYPTIKEYAEIVVASSNAAYVMPNTSVPVDRLLLTANAAVVLKVGDTTSDVTTVTPPSSTEKSAAIMVSSTVQLIATSVSIALLPLYKYTQFL